MDIYSNPAFKWLEDCLRWCLPASDLDLSTSQYSRRRRRRLILDCMECLREYHPEESEEWLLHFAIWVLAVKLFGILQLWVFGYGISEYPFPTPVQFGAAKELTVGPDITILFPGPHTLWPVPKEHLEPSLLDKPAEDNFTHVAAQSPLLPMNAENLELPIRENKGSTST